LGKKLFGKRYIGTFSQDYKPQKKPTCQYFIINNQLKGQPGEHWIAIVKNGNTYYIYDSFARHAERLIPIFSKNKLIIESDKTDSEQRGKSEICGALCLSFIATAYELGIRNALKI
jgi:hypothetical protein